MRVLITGACGFLGSHLGDALTHLGHTVFGIDNLETGRRENFAGQCAVEDIVNRRLFYPIANIAEPELIIHCAASYKDPEKWHRDTDTNVMGAINVAAVAKHHGARIIYFQTVLPPISSYAISKIAGEHYLRLSGQPLTVFKLANIYGPRSQSGPIPAMYRRIKAGEEVTAVKDVTRDFVYVDDLVAYVLAIDADGTFYVRSGVETRIDSLPRLIGNHIGEVPRVKYVSLRSDDVAHYDMDGAPLPGMDFLDGLALTLNSYENNGLENSYTHLKIGGD